MTDYVDYGDDGIVSVREDDSVEYTIDMILEYVEDRFEKLDKMGNREEDIFALCQEFMEWGTADTGDELSYFALPYHANFGNNT